MFNLAGGLSTIPRELDPRSFILTLAFLSLLMVACSPDSNNPIISSEQEAGGPEYSGIIVTTDMSVGVNRILFGVINRDGMPVSGSTPEVDAYFLLPGQKTRELKDSTSAEFCLLYTSPSPRD